MDGMRADPPGPIDHIVYESAIERQQQPNLCISGRVHSTSHYGFTESRAIRPTSNTYLRKTSKCVVKRNAALARHHSVDRFCASPSRLSLSLARHHSVLSSCACPSRLSPPHLSLPRLPYSRLPYLRLSASRLSFVMRLSLTPLPRASPLS